MTRHKKIFLIVLALFVVVLNIVPYTWTRSLKASEVPYLVNTPVDRVAFDGQGQVWAYGDGKLSVYKDGLLLRVFTKKDSRVLGGNIGGLEVDHQGRIWIGAQGSERNLDLAVFDGMKWSTILPVPGSAPSKIGLGVSAIAIDTQGRAWVGIEEQGLYIIEGAVWENHTAENSDLPSNNIKSIAFDDQGRAWIGTAGSSHLTSLNIFGSLNIFDGKVWQTFTRENSPLPKGEVLAIAFDQQGGAWIASTFGLHVINGDIMDEKNWILYPKTGEVSDIAFDGSGRVWVNSAGIIEVFDQEIRKYYFDSAMGGAAENVNYWSSFFGIMATDSDGNIWMPTKKGVAIISPNSPQPISYAAGILSIVVTTNGLIYLTCLLLLVGLCSVLDTWRSIGFSLLGFPIYLGWIIFLFRDDLGYVDLWSFHRYSPSFYGNPGFFGTIAGIIGGCVDILLARSGRTRRTWWGLTGFVIGSGLGFYFMTKTA